MPESIAMATVEEGLAAQVRNIEATYGRSIEGWVGLIRASGLRGGPAIGLPLAISNTPS